MEKINENEKSKSACADQQWFLQTFKVKIPNSVQKNYYLPRVMSSSDILCLGI